MKTRLFAAALALTALAATPALVQAQPAPTTAGALSVQTTPIGEMIKNPAAKAVLETAIPQIPQFYDQIATMTLAQVAPMSQGAIDDAKLAAIQAELDKIK